MPHIEPPAHLAALETHQLYQRVLFGSDHNPDLTIAEYIRLELQSVLAPWAGDCTPIQSKVVANVLGQVAKRLDSSPELCSKFAFPEGSGNKTLRTTTMRELSKEMRAAIKAGDQPYTLSAT